MAAHNELGKQGEEEAVRFLSKKGYVIRHRNWRSGKNELDIVAIHDNELIVVEVKTRRNTLYGNPEMAIDERKIRRIVLSTNAYIHRYRLDLPVRFDVITVVGIKEPFQIDHIEQAFYPPLW